MRIRSIVPAAALSCVAVVAYAAWLRYEAARVIQAEWIVAEPGHGADAEH